jgi:TonB family protein
MNPVNDLRNSLPFRFLSIAIACLLLMAFAGRPTNAAAYSSQRSPTDEAREAIIKAGRALRALKSFRLRMESHYADQHSTAVMEEVRPDRHRLIEKDAERIIIGEDFYERKGNGPWEKLPGKHEGMTSDISRFPESDDAESRKRYKNAKFIGRDILDNVPVLVYQYTMHDASGDRLLSTNKVWIGAQDGLPHRREAEIEVYLSEPAGGSGKQKMIYTMSDFNAEIVIERPLVPPTLQAIETEAEAKPQIIDEKQRQAVQQAAEAWLKLRDEGKTSESWEAAAQGLKAQVSKDLWERRQRSYAEQAKERGGPIKSRKLKKATFVKSLRGMRDQKGVVLEYEGTLEKSGSVSETVVLVLEQDQVWRVAMYVERRPVTDSGSGGSDPNAAATSVDQKPVPLNNPMPRYTDAARHNKTQGTVRVRVLIGADGSVKQVRMVRGLPDGLEEEAIRAAYKLRFRPAMKDGKPVAFWQAVDIEFHLGYRQ